MTANAVNQMYNLSDQLKQLPIIEVWRRYIGTVPRQRGNRFYDLCPFHGGEKHPSAVLYSDSNSWFCFGCHAGGSTIDLVIVALGVDFKTAKKVMSADFGLAAPELSPHERAEARRRSLMIKYKRELEDRFIAKVDEAHRELAAPYRAINNHLAKIKSVEDLDARGGLYHIEIIMDQALEILRNGTAKEQFAVLNDPMIRGWMGWE